MHSNIQNSNITQLEKNITYGLDPSIDQIFYQTIDAIFITDLQGMITAANPAMTKLFKTEAHFFIGKNINSFSYDEPIINPQKIEELLKQGREAKIVQEAIFLTKNMLIKAAMRLTILKDINGIDKLFIIVQDINTESSLKAQLDISKEQLQFILDFTSSMILVTNGTNVRHCNKSLIEFFGIHGIQDIDLKSLDISKLFLSIEGYISQKKKGEWLRTILRNKADGIDSKVAIKDNKKGTTNFFLVDIQPFPREKHFYTVSFRDITELENQKKKLENTKITLEEKVSDSSRELLERERMLAANEEMLSAIFDIVSAGIMMIDDKGRYVRVNKTFCEMYKTSEELILGQDFSVLLDDSMVEEMWELFRQLKEGIISELNHEWRITMRSGDTIDAIVTAKWITIHDGKRYLVCTHHDVSEKNRLEVKHREQERMLIQQAKMAAMGEMIGAIAHQWKQPLNTIALISQNITDDFETHELTAAGLQKHINEVFGQIRFMANTIDDFRNFFKPAKDKIVFDTSVAIQEIVKLMLPQFKVSYVTVSLDSSKASQYGTYVEGYPNEFKQAVLNLLTNAKEAISNRRERLEMSNSEHGTIDIQIVSNEQSVLINFADNGGGIPKPILARMFEPYFSSKETGTGIGLHMSKTIIEGKMKGKLGVKNITNGAEFFIILDRKNIEYND
jgi:PAS domain S-box-containing protein